MQPIDRLAETLQQLQGADSEALDAARSALDQLATDPGVTSAVLAFTARTVQLLERMRSEARDAAVDDLARLRAEVSRFRADAASGAGEEARFVARRDIAENIERTERALLNITSPRPGDDRLDTVFRNILTIRSAARATGLTTVADLATSVESLLDAARRRDIVLARQHLDLALEACDVMLALLHDDGSVDAPSVQSVRGLLGAIRHASAGGDLRTTASAVADGVARIGQVLIDLGVADADRVNEALSAQRSGVHVLAERLRHAGLENAEAIEAQLLQGGPLAVAIERMITRLDVIDADRLHDAVEQARASGRRLGELLDLDDADLVQVMREQRRRRRAARGGLPPARPALESTTGGDTNAATERPEVATASTVRVSAARVDALTLAIDALDATFESLAADPAF
jgi:HPt (histidine-containing phosphotransfer) domain-containing protein